MPILHLALGLASSDRALILSPFEQCINGPNGLGRYAPSHEESIAISAYLPSENS